VCSRSYALAASTSPLDVASPSACVAFDASYGSLEATISSLLGGAKVRVSREAVASPGNGLEYRVTFSSERGRGATSQPLRVVHGAGAGGGANCTAFRVRSGSASNKTTALAQVTLSTDKENGGHLSPVTAYFVRVAATPWAWAPPRRPRPSSS